MVTVYRVAAQTLQILNDCVKLLPTRRVIMKFTDTMFFKFLVCPALFILSLGFLLNSFRLTALFLLAALIVSYFIFLRSARTRGMRLIFVAFLIAVFLPIDVSPRNYPGPPRFVPLVMGTPKLETSARAEKGEVILGGCIVRGNEPRWVLVW